MNTNASSRKVSSRKIDKPVQPDGWNCQYCGKNFKMEAAYMTHFCKERTRAEEIRAPIGQAGYSYYCEWMAARKLKAPNIDTFAISRYYKSFVDFAEHVIKLNISTPMLFIKLMVDRDISPMLWKRDQCYSIYLEWHDKSIEPLDLVQLSIETLIDISSKERVELSNIFMHLGDKRIIELIKLKKLSAWCLLCSATFRTFIRTLEKDEQQRLSDAINPSYYQERMSKHPDTVEEINEINSQLGI